MQKSVEIEVDLSTWGTRAPDRRIRQRASGRQLIDVNASLMMLGNLTMPNILSAASPARTWAWIRYFEALHTSPDLRITMPFSDLDPHQKGILSDDFGVAISTQWLFDVLGGFQDIVDGRLFILHFGSLMRRRRRRTPKVGASKSPDFVIKDLAGKWHVLECKGTQSGRSFRNRCLRTAIQQKKVIQISGRIAGESLAAGLSLTNEGQRKASHLRIIDPRSEPRLELGDGAESQMESALNLLAAARALNLAGFDRMATELSLPEDIAEAAEFVRPSEKSRMRSSRSDRIESAVEQLRSRERRAFRVRGEQFEGDAITIETASRALKGGYARVSYRIGANTKILEELAGSSGLSERQRSDRASWYVQGQKISVESEEDRVVLTHGPLLYAEVTFKK